MQRRPRIIFETKGRRKSLTASQVCAKMTPSSAEEPFINRGIEQLVACQAHNLKVAGSSPAPATREPTLNRLIPESASSWTGFALSRRLRHEFALLSARFGTLSDGGHTAQEPLSTDSPSADTGMRSPLTGAETTFPRLPRPTDGGSLFKSESEALYDPQARLRSPRFQLQSQRLSAVKQAASRATQASTSPLWHISML